MGPLRPIGGNMKKITTRQIVMTGLFLALEIILQVISNYLHLGPVNLNLSLIAIVLAAVMCGPFSGAVVGFFNGVMALFSPSTLAIFMPISPVGTVLACLLKTTIAGLVAGFVFNALKNKSKILGLLLASILVPIINTGIFTIFCLLFFRSFLESNVSTDLPNIWAVLIFGIIGVNFLVEIGTTTVLSTTVGTALYTQKHKQL